MDSSEKRGPLRMADTGGGGGADKPDVLKNDILNRRKLFADAFKEIQIQIKTPLKRLAPADCQILRQAFESTKHDILSELGMEQLVALSGLPDAVSFVTSRITERLANTVTSADQFYAITTAYPQLLESIPIKECRRMLQEIEKRLQG